MLFWVLLAPVGHGCLAAHCSCGLPVVHGEQGQPFVFAVPVFRQVQRDVPVAVLGDAGGDVWFAPKMRRRAELPKTREVGKNRPLPVSPG
jgi:hypothetical protein